MKTKYSFDDLSEKKSRYYVYPEYSILFDNGYGALVEVEIGQLGLDFIDYYQLTVIDIEKFELFDTPIAQGNIRYITKDQVSEYLNQISNLPVIRSLKQTHYSFKMRNRKKMKLISQWLSDNNVDYIERDMFAVIKIFDDNKATLFKLFWNEDIEIIKFVDVNQN